MTNIFQMYDSAPYIRTGNENIVLIDERILACEIVGKFQNSSSWGNRQAEKAALEAYTRAKIRTVLGQQALKAPTLHLLQKRSGFGSVYSWETNFVPHIIEIISLSKFEEWVKLLRHSSCVTGESMKPNNLPTIKELERFLVQALSNTLSFAKYSAVSKIRHKLQSISKVYEFEDETTRLKKLLSLAKEISCLADDALNPNEFSENGLPAVSQPSSCREENTNLPFVKRVSGASLDRDFEKQGQIDILEKGQSGTKKAITLGKKATLVIKRRLNVKGALFPTKAEANLPSTPMSMECEIYYARNKDLYCVVIKGGLDNLPGFIYDYDIGNLNLKLTKVINLNSGLDSPFVGVSAQSVINGLSKHGWFTDEDSKVRLFDTVTLEYVSSGTMNTITICRSKKVFEIDALYVKGKKVIEDTPLAQALIGARVDELVEFSVDNRTVQVVIKKIEHPSLSMDQKHVLWQDDED